MTGQTFGRRLLAGFVLLFGAVCVAISLAHIALGPAAIPGSLPVNATMDNEDRFYATLFLGFGLAMAWCAGDLDGRRQVFGALLLTFFAGGLARLVSIIAVGPPAALFIALGAIELVLPPLLWWARSLTSEADERGLPARRYKPLATSGPEEDRRPIRVRRRAPSASRLAARRASTFH